jgi:hypothetical protein
MSHPSLSTHQLKFCTAELRRNVLVYTSYGLRYRVTDNQRKGYLMRFTAQAKDDNCGYWLTLLRCATKGQAIAACQRDFEG